MSIGIPPSPTTPLDRRRQSERCNSLTFPLQALLARHEAFTLEAERDREALSSTISSLEKEKGALEDYNTSLIAENRSLLSQLELLNVSAKDAETHVKSLESTLLAAQLEIRRLEAFEIRTMELERQLAALEAEQTLLQRNFSAKDLDERSAIQRWKKAERELTTLQDHVDAIERDARDEREKHVEVIGRMERQRRVEKELDTAAGRLKGAAAATTGRHVNGDGSSVISHFVKDILQDNANLQLSIIEMRELLVDSNEEVQTLREQLSVLQLTDEAKGSSLSAELEEMNVCTERTIREPPVVQQQLHIHHHYHAPREENRKPRRKRSALSPGVFTPPRALAAARFGTPDSARAILAQTSVTIPAPQRGSNRYSVQSNTQASDVASSIPSSPQSAYRNSTFFDRGVVDVDSSQPTSPTSSVDLMSPLFPPRHKRAAESRSFTAPHGYRPDSPIQEESSDGTIPKVAITSTSPETPTLADSAAQEARTGVESHQRKWTGHVDPPLRLRRATSHESIMSLSGQDIHTLKSRPSQLTTMLLRPQVSSNNLTVSYTSEIVARPTIARLERDSSSKDMLRGLAGETSSDTRSVTSESSAGAAADTTPKSKGKAPTRSWKWSPWSSSSVASTNIGISTEARETSQSAINSLRKSSGEATSPRADIVAIHRPSGINQKGDIPGLEAMLRSKNVIKNIKVHADSVDTEALREILEES